MNGIIDTADINELTRFEEFPAEIIYLIFNYLTGDDIVKSFLCLNNRFNCLIENARLNTFDLSRWTLREITNLFKTSFHHISTYSLSLKLTNKIVNENSCSANIEFIFSSLLDSYQLKNLLNNLQQIIFIRPIIDINICLPDIILQSFIIYSLNEKIIFKKNLSRQRIDNIMICNNHIIRSLVGDNGGIYNQIFVNFQNPVVDKIIPLVRHLKLYIDNYIEQWVYVSSLIINSISELTLIIIDNEFEYYQGQTFSSLLQNISNNCHLHFYIQFIPNPILTTTDTDTLVRSFQSDFYIQHQSNVTIGYCQNSDMSSDWSLLIYTSPFCASKFTLINNREIAGVCSDYTNVTRLILDPCYPNSPNIFPPNNPANLLSNVTSLEFFHTLGRHSHPLFASANNIFRQIISHIHHIHFHHIQCSSYLSKNILPLYTFERVRYIDITDIDTYGSILTDILRENNFCRNIHHLNISGLCYLKIHQIKDISMKFSKLQTLKFSMKILSSFKEQLDTISQFILINMRFHLHYVHIYFKQENLLIMSIIPSESQLGDWLGSNQKRLLHIQAIELNRNELSAWM